MASAGSRFRVLLVQRLHEALILRRHFARVRFAFSIYHDIAHPAVRDALVELIQADGKGWISE